MLHSLYHRTATIMAALLLSLLTAQAQALFRRLSAEHGLFNNQVRYLTQLPDGKILAFTEGMFHLYNGHHFEPLACDITQSVPLGMHNVCNAYRGHNDELWIKDYYRLYLIDTRTERFLPEVQDRLAKAGIGEPLNDFMLDNDKQAWLITKSGRLYYYDWQHPAQLIYTPTAAEQEHNVRVQVVIQAGPFHLIFKNNGHMMCREEKTGNLVYEEDTPVSAADHKYFRMNWAQADKRTLLIASGHTGTVYAYDIYDKTWRQLLDRHHINDIKKAADGTFWLGGVNTLVHLSATMQVLEDHSLLHTTDGKELQEYIICLHIDHHNGLWLGTGSSGILKAVSPHHYAATFTNGTAQGGNSNIIKALCPTDSTHLLVGTFGGIYTFHTTTGSFSTPYNTTATSYCNSIVPYGHGGCLICTRNGLYVLHNSSQSTPVRFDTPQGPGPIIRMALPLSNGKVLVCADLLKLYLCDLEEHTATPIAVDNPQFHRARALSFAVEVEPGQLIIGAQNGLFGYNMNTGRWMNVDWIIPFKPYSYKFNCAIKTGQVLWIGSQNGLIRHHIGTGQTTRYTEADGLPNNCINGLAQDSCKRLWVTTSRGVCCLAPTEQGISAISLDADDGLVDGELLEQAVTAMPDGSIYAGSLNGLVRIDPQMVQHPQPAQAPLLVGLKVMNTPIDNHGMYHGRQLLPQGYTYTRELILHHNENFVELCLSALNYENPSHTRYRYRLHGLEQEWRYAADPSGLCTATYTSLRPNTYTLQAQAAIDNGTWSPMAEWQIEVRPPFWLTWWAKLLYAAAVALAVYILIEVYIARKRAKLLAEQEHLERQKEQQLDELKFRFFTNISHEFRTPLALIITPLELLIRKATDTQVKTDLQKILGNAKDLLGLVNQLLDFRRLEQKGEQLKPSRIEIKEFFGNITAHFTDVARERHIDISYDCNATDSDTFALDAGKMTRVLNNLLSNALKFTPQGGMVSVWVGWPAEDNGEHDLLIIKVSDTGAGIPKEDLAQVFVRFYQSDTPHHAPLNTGSGIGLHLAKGYVELHGGSIGVESEQGQGTTFTITLPRQHEVAQPETQQPEAVTTTEDTPAESATTTGAATATAHKNITLLVAEDNEQFCAFMRDLLATEYNVLTAPNGRKALDLARECNPDLVISDVMMPEMDGYEFCKAIKSDMKCSHIPFILLTAKNSSESRAGAYEAGADSFIAKPFDIDVLQSRIHQLLEQRRLRQDTFRNAIQINPKEITITRIDEQLIERALDCMERHMSNPEYNVESLSADMGVERSSLYRKMQAIAGQTPSEFMRTVRLKRAAHLLESGQYSVQEISWMVGFNTPRYFSSYFKEMFGSTPSQYMQQAKEKGHSPTAKSPA